MDQIHSWDKKYLKFVDILKNEVECLQSIDGCWNPEKDKKKKYLFV